MKNHIGAFALLLPWALAGMGNALAAGAGAAPEAAATKCSEATLQGTYLFSYEGITITGNNKSPFASAGYEVYDGRGNVRAVSTSSTNGRITRNVPSTGKYTVNDDCTGTARYSDGTRYDQFVAPDGSAFVFIQTDPGSVATGFELRATARRVSD